MVQAGVNLIIEVFKIDKLIISDITHPPAFVAFLRYCYNHNVFQKPSKDVQLAASLSATASQKGQGVLPQAKTL